MRRAVYKCKHLADLWRQGRISLGQYYRERNHIISVWVTDAVAALVAKSIEWDRA
jgi:hypothetical protein